MNDLLSNLQTVITATWNLFNYQILPNISLKTVFIFLGLGYILMGFIHNMVFKDIE